MKAKIEKGVPFPQRGKVGSLFYKEVIEFLEKLEVGDSVLFEVEGTTVYKFYLKINNLLKVYRIIKKQDFTTELDNKNSTFRIWRIK